MEEGKEKIIYREKMTIDIEKCKQKDRRNIFKVLGKKIKLSTLKLVKTLKTEGKIKIFFQTYQS